MTAIPQFHEKRITLNEMKPLFEEFMQSSVPALGCLPEIDIPETVRLMLGDYFYGEVPETLQVKCVLHDRTIVLTPGYAPPSDMSAMLQNLDELGAIFWAMADTISHRVLAVTPTYAHRPHECFYKFFPETMELVVYVPVLAGVQYPPGFAALDGRAVIASCADTLPSFLKQ